jgi:hypothetical protein
LGVKPSEEVDVPGALHLSGERFAFVVFADVGEVVGVVAEYAADGEWSFPRGGQLVHAFLVLN